MYNLFSQLVTVSHSKRKKKNTFSGDQNIYFPSSLISINLRSVIVLKIAVSHSLKKISNCPIDLQYGRTCPALVLRI